MDIPPRVRVRVRVRSTGLEEVRTVPKELHHLRGNRGVPGYDEPEDLMELWPWEHEAREIAEGKLPGQRRDTGYDFLNFVSSGTGN